MYDFTVFNIWLLFENQWSGSLVDHGSFIIIICLTLVPVPEIPQGLIMHICKKHTHITAQSHEAVQVLSPHKSAVISSLYSNNVILQHMAQTCAALQHSWSIEEDSSCFGCGCVWKATCLLDNWGGPQLPGEKHARMYPRLRCYGWNLGKKMCTAPKVNRCNVYFFIPFTESHRTDETHVRDEIEVNFICVTRRKCVLLMTCIWISALN